MVMIRVRIRVGVSGLRRGGADVAPDGAVPCVHLGEATFEAGDWRRSAAKVGSMRMSIMPVGLGS